MKKTTTKDKNKTKQTKNKTKAIKNKNLRKAIAVYWNCCQI